jgi:hypothetical protein
VLRSVIEPIPVFIHQDASLSRGVVLAFIFGTLIAVTRTVLAAIPIVLGDFDIRSGSPTTFSGTGETMTTSISR